MIHTDKVFATQVAGYPSVFADCMLTMDMTGRMLTDCVDAGRLTNFGGRLTSQVWPGDTLTASATVTEVGEHDGAHSPDFEIVTRNQHGVALITDSARARVE